MYRRRSFRRRSSRLAGEARLDASHHVALRARVFTRDDRTLDFPIRFIPRSLLIDRTFHRVTDMAPKRRGARRDAADDVPVDLLHTTRDCARESVDEMEMRHSAELERMRAHCASFGSGKDARERALLANALVSERHARERELCSRSKQSRDDTSAEDDDDGRDESDEEDEKKTKWKSLDEMMGDERREAKPSRAARRRAKRDDDERARANRIASDMAQLGVSEKDLETNALNARLREFGMRVKEVRADGHCLYRALADQLERRGGDGVALDVDGLRMACARTMREDEERYRPFVEDCDGDDDEADARWARYVSDVESTAAWGGQVELMALAKAIERPIEVFSATMPTVRMGEEFAGAALRVAYHRHAYGLGEHYNSVEDVEER